MSTPNESLQVFRARLYGSAIPTYAMCMLVVPLKIWCRVSRNVMVKLGWDDAMCVVALVLASVFFFIGIFGLGQDLGEHYPSADVSPSELVVFLEFLFPEQLLYLVCIAANKFAVIAFYWRLFSVKARIPLLTMSGIVAAWTIALVIAVVLTCKPIAAQWDPTIPGAKCGGLRELYLGGSVPNILTDCVLLMIPLPYVWRLNVRIGQRLMIVSIFLLGCFVGVVSIVRLVKLMETDLASPDYPWKMKEVLLWSVVEVNVGLICACLPSLKPAIRLLGLDRLLGFGDSRHEAGRPSRLESPAFLATVRSKSPRKGLSGGLFSSIAGITKVDDEGEDSFDMIPKVHQAQGTVTTKITRTTSANSFPSEESAGVESGNLAVVRVKRDRSVLVEPQQAHAR